MNNQKADFQEELKQYHRLTTTMHTANFVAKQAAAKAAVEMIENGMLIGLGTGSTTALFIEYLIDRYQNQGLNIKVMPSSERTAQQALAGGIPLCDENTTTLDITVDGADEVDHKKRLIKGGGGALLREKIVASMSKEMIVIIDESKLVDKLGGFDLPIEIVRFAHQATLFKVRNLGYDGKMRFSPTGELYSTDNGNYIIDIHFPHRCDSPEIDHAVLSSIPGVIQTGFFFGIASHVIIGQTDGSVKNL